MHTPTIDDLLTPAERGSIRAPISSALTFPRRAYTSDDHLRFETERVFWRNWTALCFGSQLAAAASVHVVEAFGVPLIAVRDDQRVRVFHNVCPYDGSLLMPQQADGETTLDSPYHGWRYDLSGALIDAPFWSGPPGNAVEAVPEAGRRLSEVRAGEALGMVFVNISGDAPSLAAHLKGLRKALADYDIDGVTERGDPGAVFDDSVATNWKTFAENDCLNVLHESFVHELYAMSPEIPRVAADGTPRFEVVSEHNVCGFSYAEEDVGQTYGEVTLPHIGASARPDRGFFLQLYPNVSMAVLTTAFAPMIQFPDSPAQTSLVGAQFMHPDAAEDSEAGSRVAGAFIAAAEEDAAVVEMVQAGRRSPGVEQNFFSPFWDQPHYLFLNRILDDLEPG